jgi:SRSO17 transposase
MADRKTAAITVRALALGVPARAWRRVTWRNGTNRPWAARFTAVRVTPANEWRNRRLAPEVWLLCEQDLGLTPRIKYFFINLPATASLKQLVRLAHQRWAIEQQYQELKTELGLDHFEGRSFPGWQHHVVLTAVAYAFLQRERMRHDADPALTLPAARDRHGDFHGALIRPETVLSETNSRTTENSNKVVLAARGETAGETSLRSGG